MLLKSALCGKGHAAVTTLEISGCGSKPVGSHFGVGEFTTQIRTYFSGDWDVHWGYGIFDPWPSKLIPLKVMRP